MGVTSCRKLSAILLRVPVCLSRLTCLKLLAHLCASQFPGARKIWAPAFGGDKKQLLTPMPRSPPGICSYHTFHPFPPHWFLQQTVPDSQGQVWASFMWLAIVSQVCFVSSSLCLQLVSQTWRHSGTEIDRDAESSQVLPKGLMWPSLAPGSLCTSPGTH